MHLSACEWARCEATFLPLLATFWVCIGSWFCAKQIVFFVLRIKDWNSDSVLLAFNHNHKICAQTKHPQPWWETHAIALHHLACQSYCLKLTRANQDGTLLTEPIQSQLSEMWQALNQVVSSPPLMYNRRGKERAFGGRHWKQLVYTETVASAVPCQIAFSSYGKAVE